MNNSRNPRSLAEILEGLLTDEAEGTTPDRRQEVLTRPRPCSPQTFQFAQTGVEELGEVATKAQIARLAALIR